MRRGQTECRRFLTKCDPLDKGSFIGVVDGHLLPSSPSSLDGIRTLTGQNRRREMKQALPPILDTKSPQNTQQTVLFKWREYFLLFLKLIGIKEDGKRNTAFFVLFHRKRLCTLTPASFCSQKCTEDKDLGL